MPIHIRTLLTGGTILAGIVLISNAAGPLSPPAPPGDPASDMPSLTEIRTAALMGRTPIPPGTTTVTLTAPGHYVLTGNITVGAQDGIVIPASDVTLDLNGFTIATTSTTPGAYRGVHILGDRVIVRNGRIVSSYSNFGGVLSGGGFAAGVEGNFNVVGGSANVTCEDLHISGCQIGISLYWPQTSHVVRRCSVRHAQSGILIHPTPAGVEGMVSDCIVEQCTSSGIVAGLVRDCFVMMNGSSSPTAVYASLAIGCHCTGGGVSIGNRYNMP